MRQSNSVAVLLLGVIVGCAAERVFVVPPAAAQNVQRWEYACREASGERETTGMANEFGKQGWELVAEGTFGMSPTWCFKRPLQ
jgi:hypothetical protein